MGERELEMFGNLDEPIQRYPVFAGFVLLVLGNCYVQVFRDLSLGLTRRYTIGPDGLPQFSVERTFRQASAFCGGSVRMFQAGDSLIMCMQVIP